MTPAEHRADAEILLQRAMLSDDIPDGERPLYVAAAHVHATLALAPTPPPTVQPPQTRFDLSKPSYFPTATGGVLTVTPGRDKTGLVLNYEEDAWLMEDPADLRTLASLLTAHADRLESKP